MTRFGYVMATYSAALGFGVLAVVSPGPKFIWNASASVPVGLYVLHPVGKLRVGDLLAIKPPTPLAAFLGQRHYLPLGVPMLKHVAALSRQTVCRNGRNVTVDGKAVAVALDRDRLGRPLPVWNGCRIIAPGAVFLLNARWDSLDGRYFGPLPMTSVMGRADVWGGGDKEETLSNASPKVCPR